MGFSNLTHYGLYRDGALMAFRSSAHPVRSKSILRLHPLLMSALSALKNLRLDAVRLKVSQFHAEDVLAVRERHEPFARCRLPRRCLRGVVQQRALMLCARVPVVVSQ
jgi:hypothetical protein